MSKPRKDEWAFKYYTAKEKLSLGEKETEFVFHADLQQPVEAVNSFWLNKTKETSVKNPPKKHCWGVSFSPPDLSMRVRSAHIQTCQGAYQTLYVGRVKWGLTKRQHPEIAEKMQLIVGEGRTGL